MSLTPPRFAPPGRRRGPDGAAQDRPAAWPARGCDERDARSVRRCRPIPPAVGEGDPFDAAERALTADRPILRAIPIAVVLSIVAGALLLIAFAYWRRGTFALGVAMLLAGVLRAVLSERTIGVLAVRGKGFDPVSYTHL